MRPLKENWRIIVYLSIGAAIFVGFGYLGVNHGFSNRLDLAFVAILWIFVSIAMKSSFIKAPAKTPLPLSAVSAKFNVANLIRALLFFALAMGWTAVSVSVVHARGWDDSYYAVAFVFIPVIVLIGFFVRFLVKSFAIDMRSQ